MATIAAITSTPVSDTQDLYDVRYELPSRVGVLYSLFGTLCNHGYHCLDLKTSPTDPGRSGTQTPFGTIKAALLGPSGTSEWLDRLGDRFSAPNCHLFKDGEQRSLYSLDVKLVGHGEPAWLKALEVCASSLSTVTYAEFRYPEIDLEVSDNDPHARMQYRWTACLHLASPQLTYATANWSRLRAICLTDRRFGVLSVHGEDGLPCIIDLKTQRGIVVGRSAHFDDDGGSDSYDLVPTFEDCGSSLEKTQGLVLRPYPLAPLPESFGFHGRL